jgi:hypothetical protein
MDTITPRRASRSNASHRTLLHHSQRVKQVWQAFGIRPAYSIAASPLDLLSRLLPHIPWILDEINFSWKSQYERQPLPGLSFSYIAHSPCPGAFAASNSDIVHLAPVPVPVKTTQGPFADATAVKVVLVSKWLLLCSVFPFRVSFRAVRHFPRLCKT